MKKTLPLLMQLAHGISTEFGTSCEIVIHDLKREDTESSIVHIENGHVTNRAIGDGPSGIVLETLEKISEGKPIPDDQLAYLTKTVDGRILKSSTIYIRNEDNSEINYIFSLNYDITNLITVDTALRSLIETSGTSTPKPTAITHNVADLLDTLIEQSMDLIGKPVALMTKEDKIQAIQFLNNAGAFLITKSGDKVSTHFGISKFTLYSYIDAAKQL